MSSASGGNSRTGQTPATTKIKNTVTKNPASTHRFSTTGKKGKVFNNENENEYRTCGSRDEMLLIIMMSVNVVLREVHALRGFQSLNGGRANVPIEI
jgi:hypothetical protein